MKDEFKTGNNYSFSDDPREDLTIENEIMKLKMHAERAAVFARDKDELPPEIEAQFLENVQIYEAAYDSGRLIPVYEYIGAPAFITADAISEEYVETELERLLELLRANNISLDVLKDHDPSLVYKFITEELFFEKIADINLPNYIHGSIYEEFHPNH